MVQNEKAFQIFSFIRTVFTYLGLPTFRTMFVQRSSKPFVFLFSFNAAFGEFVVWSSVFRVYYKILFETMNRGQWVEAAVAFGFGTQLLLRTLILYFKRKSVDDYLSEIDKITFITIDGKDNFLKLFENEYRTTKKAGKIIFQSQTVTGLSTVFLGIFFVPLESSLLPVGYPFMNSHYAMKYFYRVVDSLAPFYTMRSSGMDLSILTFLKFHVVQQEYLRRKLENILKGRSETKREKETLLREWFQDHQYSLK